MRRTIWIAMLAIVTLVLAACSAGGGGGGIVPIPDRAAETVDADLTRGTGDLSEEPSIGRTTLAPGEEYVYRVELPASDEPALYVYIDQPLPLYVYDRNDVVATSQRPEWFASGTGGLQATSSAEGLEGQDISVAQDCPGACVILDNPGSGALYVRVRNTTTTTQTYTLYTVLRPYTDTNEDFDDFVGVPVLDLGDTESGAIESIGDVDYYRVGSSTGDFYLDYLSEDTGIDLVAEIQPAGGGSPLFVEPNEGSGFAVFPGDEIRIYAENPRAAVSAYSQYSVTVEAPE